MLDLCVTQEDNRDMKSKGTVAPKSDLLERKSRVERLREIVAAVKRGEKFSAFFLAVKYNVSINVVYRDIKTLRNEKLIPKTWQFERKDHEG